jgi:hypothetical protein
VAHSEHCTLAASWSLVTLLVASRSLPALPKPGPRRHAGGEEYEQKARANFQLRRQGRNAVTEWRGAESTSGLGVVLEFYKPKPGSKLRLKLPMVALLAFGMSEFTRVQLVVLTDGFEQRRLYS